jgi:hypothetical protein
MLPHAWLLVGDVVSDISKLENLGLATDGLAVWRAGEVTTNGNVEDDVQGLGSEGLPHSLAVDGGTSDAVELLAVLVPDDSLLLPVALAEVELDPPDNPRNGINRGPTRKTNRLIADTTGRLVAVNNTNADVITIDILEDVNLSARRPQNSVPVRLAHHPERGPDTLLLGLLGAADAQLALDTSDLAGSRGERVLALDAAACPAADGGAVLLGHDLKTAFSGVPDIGGLVGVSLPLIVEDGRGRDGVPFARDGRGISSGIEMVGPFSTETVVGRGRVGRDGGAEEGDDGHEGLRDEHDGGLGCFDRKASGRV